MNKALVPVISAPFLDPALGRREINLPHGLTIAEIIAIAMPGTTEADWSSLRVILVTEKGMQVVDRRYWHLAKPHPGVSVVIRPIPSGNFFKQILAVVVSIAAIALGQIWGVALAGTFGLSAGVWTAAVTIGLSVLGNLAINALIPTTSSSSVTGDATKANNYSITGWKNQVKLNEPVPAIYGKIRYAPPFAALPYTEIVNDLQYIRCVFCFGYGPVKITDHQIGDTSMDEYDDIDIEVREGRDTDELLTLYTRQVIEEQVGAELQRPLPRDDAGNIISGASIETPLVRTTARSVTSGSVIFNFPSGLGSVDDAGNLQSLTVSIRIRQKKLPDGDWEAVTTLNITAGKLEAFFRQYSWEFPERGTYEVECTRMTDEHASTRIQSRSTWSVIQSSRPEYPFNMSKPFAHVAIRVKASYQLNGILDNYNALASRMCLDFDEETGIWAEAETSNVASAYRLSLQGSHTAKPVLDSGLDLDSFESLHTFCKNNDLKFDGVIDTAAKAGEVWQHITHAGRSMHWHNGIQWSVITDRPADLPIVDHISHRDTFNFSCKRQYIEPPHAFRVQFQDATNDYKTAERIIPWPGYTGDITVTELLELPGKTDPDEIWIEARRRQYEILKRPDVFTAMRDTPIAASTRGSRVAASFPILKSQQVAARVKTAVDYLIELDDDVTMIDGQTYAIRFQKISEEDTIGESIVRLCRTIPGTTRILSLADGGDLPDIGQMVQFGVSGQQNFDLVVTRIEAGEKMASVLQLSALAPEIDVLLAADVPPAWSGVVGSEIDDTSFAPLPPVFATIVTGVAGTGVEGRIRVGIHAASSGAAVSTFEIEHRKTGAWTVATIAAADGAANIDGYLTGDVVEIRALARTTFGVASAYNTTVAIVVGNDDADVPSALPGGITVTALLGGATVAFTTNDSAATVGVNIYSNISGALDKATDLKMNVATMPSNAYSRVIGDATRVNRFTTSDYSSTGAWVTGAGWTIGAGVASHAAGSASDLSQMDGGLTAAQYYRLGFTLSGVSAGNLAPVLKGTTTVAGVARTANGTYLDRLLSAIGNNESGFAASSDFVGSIDNVVIYRETATCLPQGTNYVWLAPVNVDGIEGPVSGPYTVVII
jgi:predicted phage tail protein